MSIKQIYIASGSGVTLSTGLDTYTTLNGIQNQNITEANKQQYLRVNGSTYQNLASRVSANTLNQDCNVNFRLAGSLGNQTDLITAGNTGLFKDLLNSDICATDSLIDLELKVPVATGSATLISVSVVSSPSSNYRIYSKDNGTNIASTNVVIPLVGGGASASDVFQSKFRVAGTLKKSQITVSANTSVSDNTVSLIKNGSAGNISVPVTALNTGVFENTSSTDAMAVTDTAYWAPQNTGGTTTATVFAVAFSSDDVSINEVLTCLNTTVADGLTRYSVLSAQSNASATELTQEMPIDFEYTVSKLEVYADINTTTSDNTVDFRVGAASPSGTLTAVPTAGNTGFFADLVNVYTGASADLANYRMVNGGGGSLTLRQLGMLMTEVQPAPVVSSSASARKKTRMLMGVGL